MKTLKLQGLDNKEIKVPDEHKPKFKHNIFQPYCRVALVGSSGSGKSNAFINLFEKMYPQIDLCYAVSATLGNDPKQQLAFMNRDKIRVFDEPNEQLIKLIQQDAQRIQQNYNHSIKIREAYEKWKQRDFDETQLSPKDYSLLATINFDLNMLPWKEQRRPNLILWLDDLQGTPVLRGKALENLVIKARHLNINVFMACQTWVGTSANIRRNLSGYMVFFTPDQKVLKGVFDEIMGLFKSWEQFLAAYEYATSGGRHQFLYIDANDPEFPIRRNFNEPIILGDDNN